MYKLILATRYLVKRRITYLAMGVVALSVFVVLVVMTVLQGLVEEFKERTHTFVGDCVVGTNSLVGFPYYEEFLKVLEQSGFVEATSPLISTYGLVGLADKEQAAGLRIVGVDPVLHSRVTGFGRALHFHRDAVEDVFKPINDPNLPGCVVGVDLVLNRDATGQYDYDWVPIGRAFEITCFPLTAKGGLAKAGAGEVSTKRFYFSDTAHTGLPREDDGVVYLPFEQVQQLSGMAGPIPRTTALYVKFQSGVEIDDSTRRVDRLWKDFGQGYAGRPQADLLQSVLVKDWKTYRRASIAPLEKEELAMVVMFILVAVTAVFIVFVVFYMIVGHKSKDIGILKSVGASNAGIIGLFSGFAVLVGCLGGGVGLVGGWIFLLKINRLEDWLFEHFDFQLWDRTLFAIGDIPSQIQMEVVVIVVLCSVGVCLLGALVPTLKAARTRPIETLQVSQL
jgi:lipoprotein-releasing system permease protein